MKAETGTLVRSFGEIKLLPENIDDLWHLSHLIIPGDVVYATTLRATETQADKIRPEKAEKRPVRLGIRVTKVEFHDFAIRLRVGGWIEEGVDAGAHHTFNIEPGYEISVIRTWTPVDRERIERAVRGSLYDVVHVLTVEHGDAELYRIRQFGPEFVQSFVSGSGKGMGTESATAFYDRIGSEIRMITGPLIVAGPGFVKEDFLRYARSRNFLETKELVVADTRRSGYGAVQEVIGDGLLEALNGDLQLKREVGLMDEVLARIAKDEPVAYGIDDVKKAVQFGAASHLLIEDTLIRQNDIAVLSEEVFRMQGNVTVLSSRFEPGKRLMALGGVAALLRYPIT
jgi:protein pelota